MPSGTVYFFFEDVKFPLSIKRSIKKWLRTLISSKGFSLENINLIFCSDSYLLKVNKEHLNHDYFTDIITFDYCVDNKVNGDLFISYDRVIENAFIHKASQQEELLRVIAHGTLHLLRFSDKSLEDKEIMRNEEDRALEFFHGLDVSRETSIS